MDGSITYTMKERKDGRKEEKKDQGDWSRRRKVLSILAQRNRIMIVGFLLILNFFCTVQLFAHRIGFGKKFEKYYNFCVMEEGNQKILLWIFL